MATVEKMLRTRPDNPTFLPAAPVDERSLPGGWPPVWWIGCHGGSGATTLARLTGLGIDFGRAWPYLRPDSPMADVVLVCRASATGTWAATGAVEQVRRKAVPTHVRVRGLVVVSASPRKPPRIVTERVQLLSGWLPKVWPVGWHEALLAADQPLDVGMPPDVAALRNAIATAVANT